MICLHRIRGEELWVNPDLIVFVETTGHDTMVTLADGNHVLVTEGPAEIGASVARFRATVLAAADELSTFFVAADGIAPCSTTGSTTGSPTSAPVVSLKQARAQRMGG
jgi:uncharacterized protein YlzI (FlbEa/FlbD family)